MVLASLLFALMGLCVKLASAHYGAGEIVLYRGAVGALLMAGLCAARGGTLRTALPGGHLWRSLSGSSALVLWFYAIAELPLATAVTLNYMSSVWMALILIGGAIALGGERVDARLLATVVAGFAGVAMVLQPAVATDRASGGFAGLASGVFAALAYLQVRALGRAGEPEYRIVFYFALGGVATGALIAALAGPLHRHSVEGALLLLAVGLLATAAQMMITRAYAQGLTLVNASLQYSGIAWSFVFGMIWFDDPANPLALAGMALIAGAGVAATRLGRGAADSQRGAVASPS